LIWMTICDGGIFDYDDDVSMLEAAKDEEERR
jgi:hypothetical protein